MDSICCSICADEPITYALKNINGKENMEILQEKYANNNNDEDNNNSSEISHTEGSGNLQMKYVNNGSKNNSFSIKSGYNEEEEESIEP